MLPKMSNSTSSTSAPASIQRVFPGRAAARVLSWLTLTPVGGISSVSSSSNSTGENWCVARTTSAGTASSSSNKGAGVWIIVGSVAASGDATIAVDPTAASDGELTKVGSVTSADGVLIKVGPVTSADSVLTKVGSVAASGGVLIIVGSV